MDDPAPPPTWPGHVPDGNELDVYLAHVGRAGDLLLRERWLVAEVMRRLAAGLIANDLPDKHLALLATFLRGLAAAGDYKTSLAVLGRSDLIKAGAPSKDEPARWWETREVYEHLIEEGESDEQALHAAWETWVFDPDASEQKSFEVESRRPAGEGKTTYQQQIEMLKSRLNRAGSRIPARRGRKPKNIAP
jgi:hypothetical protein